MKRACAVAFAIACGLSACGGPDAKTADKPSTCAARLVGSWMPDPDGGHSTAQALLLREHAQLKYDGSTFVQIITSSPAKLHGRYVVTEDRGTTCKVTHSAVSAGPPERDEVTFRDETHMLVENLDGGPPSAWMRVTDAR